MLDQLKTELKLKGFSQQTINSYIFHNKKFLEFCGKQPENITKDDVKKYIGYLLVDKKLEPSSAALARASLKFFYSNVLNKKEIVDVKVPKKKRKIPIILSRDDIIKMIKVARKPQHRLLVQMLYSTGLRLSELTNLKFKDLELDENIGWVRSGKGGKDRMIQLSKNIIEELKKLKANSDSYVFQGRNGHLSKRAVQKTISELAKRAGINKSVHPHTIRHSYATHLLDNGVDIRKIQVLLGHASLDTTQIYTQVSQQMIKDIENPLDKLYNKKESSKNSGGIK